MNPDINALSKHLAALRGRLYGSKEFIHIFCSLKEDEQKALPNSHHSLYGFNREIMVPKIMSMISRLERILEGVESTKDTSNLEERLKELSTLMSRLIDMEKKAREDKVEWPDDKKEEVFLPSSSS